MNQNKFSNNEDNPEKLLIIGNGFDLECGLQSNIKDYINFLASIKKIRFDKKNISIEDDELNEDIEEVLKTSPSTTSVEQGLKFFDDLKGKISVNFENLTISFWDLVFLDYHKKSKNWNDVENAISNFSTNYTGFPYIYPQLHSLLNKFYLFASQNNKKFVEYLTSENFLFTELKKFEGNFKCYLEEAVKKSESTNSYKKNSIRLLNKLTDNKKYNIISFNYTLPFLYNKDSSNFLQVYKNVHGHIDNRIFNKTEKGETSSIIFGIDSQGINSKSPEYKFTKTYRTLDTTYKTVKDLLNHNISEIIFYGHSLNKSDFSYFMAVFDNFDIYNNTKLSLTFAYNSTVPHDKIDKFNQVSNLMFEYGRTLNNNHGNNLLHKLIIEGRISLKDIHL